MFVYGMGCSFRGWDVCIQDRVEVLIYGIRCLYRGWGVCIRDGVFVNGIGC